MKVMTVGGTRPEWIRLCRIIPKLDKLCNHILLDTGQNYDQNLSEIFFFQLGIRQPDYYLGAKGSFGEQAAIILSEGEKVLLREKPDRFLVLGDTNSSLLAVMAKRLNIPVYHMEAGNRSFDMRMPEEVNRHIIDHCADVNLPYTERSRQHLLQEGLDSRNILVTGNPIYEVLNHFKDKIDSSTAIADMGLRHGNYFLATIHRAENVDHPNRLKSIVSALYSLSDKYNMPVVMSTHPHTRNRTDGLLDGSGKVVWSIPLGYFEFINLMKWSKCVLTDSGTVPEETSILGIPNVVVRDATERMEIVECGSAILSGVNIENIINSVNIALNRKEKWTAPREYLVDNVSDTVVNIVLGHNYWHSIQHRYDS